MVDNLKIAFIGSGVMAEAMITGLLREKVIVPERITASGPRPERGDHLRQAFGVHVTTDNAAALQDAKVVVFSVKPQVLAPVMAELQGRIPTEALVLSIVAGARIDDLKQGLGCESVIRSMPNTPAQIGAGITVWTASEEATQAQREQARTILQALGQEIFVEDEDYLNAATALSGTGPAYVFLFMEAMVDAGVHLGFPRYMAERLVLQTMRGSVEYVRQSEHHLARLRNQVTSPGGTAAEALYYLERAGLRTAISRAVWAAYQRSVTLGQGKKKGKLAEGGE
ncbi:MAG: pyrroline-5-carboxylate reductase [Anaerolineales bacterium]|jgi:pyrroline-5-carboxylate reductase